MSEARQRDEWSRTSSLMALVANMVRGKSDPVATPAEFDPFHAKAKAAQPIPKVKMRSLKGVFFPNGVAKEKRS